MPGKVKVKIIAGRNLPVMDRSSDTTDAYVEIKLGNTTYKTDVCRKSLNPQWNSEWYRFEVDDSELQDEPLQIRLMDYDTYSANDAIGKVYLNLNPLLIPTVAVPSKYGWSGESNTDQPSSSMMSGWIPVYDTMHGIRGEVNVTVKVELFSDFNKFRQSSCGVQFFCSPVIPHGYHAQVIHGFIEELVVNDDPEYQWIDKIRTPRASNEARQTLFFKLSGELQRKIGVKALDLGGNAVIGYNQCFDLEGESGIVARGIGTVVTLIKHHEMQQQLTDIGIAEEKALSYLKFLAFDNGLKLENDNIFERFTLSNSNQNNLSFPLILSPFELQNQNVRSSPRRNIPMFIRQSSQPLLQLDYHSPLLKPCISSRSLSDDVRDEIVLQQLIQQEDMRSGSISSNGISRKIRYLKQNMLTKKMTALKAKLSETIMPEQLDLEISTLASKSTNSSPIRTSLIDLRELRKKKKSKLHQKNSSYMAELLVRSVIQAHTSLDCIVECHDSSIPGPSSTSKLNEDLGEGSSHQSLESQNTVLECDAVTGLIGKTISEPYLLLPDNRIITQSSNASSSSEISSSSDVSESPSDGKDDKLDFDTISLIVKNVQEEEKQELRFRNSSDNYQEDEGYQKQEEIEDYPEEQDIPLSVFNKKRIDTLFRSHALNISFEIPSTAPIIIADRSEFFFFPKNVDKKIETLSHSSIFNSSFRKGKLNRELSKSCEHIEMKSNNTNSEEISFRITPDIEKKVRKLNQSALFNSSFRMHANKSKLTKQLSKSNIDICNNSVDIQESEGFSLFIQPPQKFTTDKSPIKRNKLTKELSKSCEQVNQNTLVINQDELNFQITTPDLEKKIEMLSHSALFNSSFRMHAAGNKLRRNPSKSYENIFKFRDNAQDSRLHLSIQSPLDSSFIQGEFNKVLYKSCEDINQITQTENQNKADLQTTSEIEERLETLSHTSIFNSSFRLHGLKNKKILHRDFSKSFENISSNQQQTKKSESLIKRRNFKGRKMKSRSDPDIRQVGLLKTAMNTMLIEKINLMTPEPAPLSPRIKDLLSENDPELFVGNKKLVETAINTMLIEKVNLLTFQNAPISERVKEEFQSNISKSFSRSDPDLNRHNLLNKIHVFSTKPLHLFQHKKNNTYSNPDLANYQSVKEMLLDKMHHVLSHHKDKNVDKNIKEEEEIKSIDSYNSVKHKLLDKIHDILPHRKSKQYPPLRKTLSKSNPNLIDDSFKNTLIDNIYFITQAIPHHKHHDDIKKSLIKSNSKSNPDLRKHEKHSTFIDKIHFMTSKTNHETEPVIHDHSLIKAAIQTMLLDKVNVMTSSTPPISPNVEEKFSFIHNKAEEDKISSPVSSKLEKDIFDDRKRSSFIDEQLPKHRDHHHLNLDKVKNVVHNVLDKVHILSPRSEKDFIFETRKHAEEHSSLMKTAMQTMLLDKVQILTPMLPTPEDSIEHEDLFKNSLNEHYQMESQSKIEEHDVENQSLIKTAMHTMLIENSKEGRKPDHHHHNLDKIKAVVHNVLDKVLTPTSAKNETEFDFDESKDESLMKTAMQTMLLEKVSLVAPETSVVVKEEIHSNEEKKESIKLEHHSHNLDKIKSAMHTVLDKVHILTPTSPTSEKEFYFHKSNEHSLMQTAMQTMLIEKVNLVAPESIFEMEDQMHLNEERIESIKPELHSHNFDKVETEMHTDLDKVHILTPTSPKSEKEFNFNKNGEESLMKTAMQTMLLDKVQILTPNSEDSTQFIASKSPERAEYYKEGEGIESIVSGSNEHDELKGSLKKDVKLPFLRNLKKRCKSFKKSFSKLIHKKSKVKSEKNNGLVSSAMTTILMDKVNSIQGTLSSGEEVKIPIVSSISDPYLAVPYLETCDKANLVDMPLTSLSAEEPNVNRRLDNGFSRNYTTAITADDANCDTNAEHAPCLHTSDRRIVESPIPEREHSGRERHGHQRTESTGGKMSQSPARLNAIPCIHRRSSDSDLSITPKGNSLTSSDRSGGALPGYHHLRSTLLRPTVDNFDMMEYPFLTMSKYPPGFILHLGGAVSARSVKLLERITNIEEPETRDTWWSELRMEIRTHARALNCNAVLGYQESTSICDEVCVLSAAGTAAVIALYSGEVTDGVGGLPILHKPHVPNKDLMTSSLDRTDFERDSKNSKQSDSSTNVNAKITESPETESTIEFSGTSNTQSQSTSCRICHIPYSESSMSFRINMLHCTLCRMAKVPDIILATIEIPESLPITGRGCFLQSYVCRPKRDLKGELNAKEISESLPFLEYELHRLLVNKMKVKAMNTIFGLKVRITIGEKMLVGVATGTAVYLLPLPPPPLPKLIAGNATTEDKKLSEMQKLLVDTVKKNKEIYELKDQDYYQNTKMISDTEESDDEKSNIDLAAGNKDSCVLEVDDSEDIEVINLLVEPRPPDGFHVVNTENVPGLDELEIVKNLQMFTQVWRAKIPLNQSASHFGKHFQKLLQSVYFKLRRMIPCALCDLQFRVDIPEPDEIQLTLLGMALGLGDPVKLNKYKRKNLCHLPPKDYNKKSDDELIFNLEEDQIPENSVPVISQGGLLNPQVPKHRQKSPQRLRVNIKQRHTPIKERHGVDITPLSYVPGGKIERYLGYLNFFFIRETTSIREGGGLSGFVHSFLTEVLAIVRAHVTALGGNAMVSYFMTECVLYHNAHKNQGQCLINVGGDVVFVSYFTEDN